jgi:hypothetical protein
MLHNALLATLIATFASACAWDRTWPLETVAYAGPRLEAPFSLLRLHSAVTGKPLRETVWENEAGPRWDPRASTRIGFAQLYADPVDQIGAGSILTPAPVGSPPSAPGRTISRLSVPFGRLLVESLESAATAAPEHFAVCDSAQCDPAQFSADARVADLALRFSVWEEPLNHLNLAARLEVTCAWQGGTPAPAVITHARLARPLSPGGLSWHRQIVARMNAEANAFAHELTGRVLTACGT